MHLCALDLCKTNYFIRTFSSAFADQRQQSFFKRVQATTVSVSTISLVSIF